MKKLLCMLLCVLLLTGCLHEPAPETIYSTEPARETSASTEPPVETTVPTEPAPTLPQAAVTEYEGLTFNGFVSMVAVSDTRVAAGEYAMQADGTEKLSICVVDLEQGTRSESLQLGDAFSLSMQQILLDRFLVENYPEKRYLVYGSDLQLRQSISVPELYGFFTRELDTYYYLQGRQLMAYTTATGEAYPLECARELLVSYLLEYDQATGILLCCVYKDPYSYETCNVALNTVTGELLLFNDIQGSQRFWKNGILTEAYSMDGGRTDIFVYTYGDSGLRGFEAPLEANEYLWMLPGSEYLLISALYEEGAQPGCTQVYRIGEDLSFSQELTQQLTGESSMSRMPDGSWICACQTPEGYRLKLLRPDQFHFEPFASMEPSDRPLVDLQLQEQYQQALQGPEVSPELAQVRALADAIEEDFGITVLLSNQCERPARECEFPIVTTDQVDWMEESWYISDALHILRRSLELYPEGFFAQFKQNGSSYGLLVLLVEDIQSQNDAIGVCWGMSNWYPIAVDITSYDLMSTYCHELWHATENLISEKNYDIFEGGHWERMNPEGFTYSYDSTLGYIGDTDWTYYGGWYGPESYFVDAYARTNAKEDRARLMEYLMAYEEEARALMEAPALREKAEYLCQAIRRSFNTEGWENVWWERFWTEP